MKRIPDIELSNISRFRGELMGAAMLFIMLFHVDLARSDAFFGLRRMGNIGVDMFLFLSGIGLWFSWAKNPSVKRFYFRRFVRIYPAWLIIAALFYLPKFHGGSAWSWIDLIGELGFNWEFWLRDELNFWYIPAIMMLYLFAPPYMELIRRHPIYRWLPVVMVMWCILVQWVTPINHAVGHLEIFWSRVPIFFIGINMGEMVRRKQTVDGQGISHPYPQPRLPPIACQGERLLPFRGWTEFGMLSHPSAFCDLPALSGHHPALGMGAAKGDASDPECSRETLPKNTNRKIKEIHMHYTSLLKLIRPAQWMKNAFVFCPVMFGGKLFETQPLLSTLITFMAFSFVASSIYCYNDICDLADDIRHPEKCHRPIASGAVTIAQAYGLMFLLFLMSIGCCALLLTVGSDMEGAAVSVGSVILFYWLMNLGYCAKLKQYAVIDVCVVAFGFVLRLFAGGFATGIVLSKWIVLMTFLLTLFMSLAKRRDDVLRMEQTGQPPRKNTIHYNMTFINQSITITAAVTLVCYIMYTVSPEVIAAFHNDYLYLTSIFVLVGILRYLQIAVVEKKSGNLVIIY